MKNDPENTRNCAAYREALRIWRQSSSAFRKVEANYRAKRIGDREYLANRKAFRSAQMNMDRAEAIEKARFDALPVDENGVAIDQRDQDDYHGSDL